MHDLEAGKERLPVSWRLDDVDAIMSCLVGLLQKMMAGCDTVGMCSSPGYTGMGSRLKLRQQRKHMARPLRVWSRCIIRPDGVVCETTVSRMAAAG